MHELLTLSLAGEVKRHVELKCTRYNVIDYAKKVYSISLDTLNKQQMLKTLTSHMTV